MELRGQFKDVSPEGEAERAQDWLQKLIDEKLGKDWIRGYDADQGVATIRAPEDKQQDIDVAVSSPGEQIEYEATRSRCARSCNLGT